MVDKNIKVSEKIEEYLEIMYRLKEKGEKITTTVIASLLKISPPSVTEMLDKLAKQGYIEHERYKEIILTKKGEEYGKKILNSHRTWEIFLIDFLRIKVPKDAIHETACKLEHVSSSEIIEGISKLIEKEAIEQDETKQKNEISLTDMHEENNCTVAKIYCGKCCVDQLENLGVTSGKKIKVINKQPYGPITIETSQSKVSIGRKIAGNICVKI